MERAEADCNGGCYAMQLPTGGECGELLYAVSGGLLEKMRMCSKCKGDFSRVTEIHNRVRVMMALISKAMEYLTLHLLLLPSFMLASFIFDTLTMSVVADVCHEH